MASIKVKFRSSIVSGKEGMLYYQACNPPVEHELSLVLGRMERGDRLPGRHDRGTRRLPSHDQGGSANVCL